MAEKDRKTGYDAEQQQQQQQQARLQQEPQQQTDRGNVSQQAAELMLAILQQVQTQIRLGTLNLTTAIEEEQLKNAAFAGAAFTSIENGLALLPALKVTALSSRTGSRAGGLPLTISGENFLPGSKVSFRSDTGSAADLKDVVVKSNTELEGTTPEFPTTGFVNVFVVTSIGGEVRDETGGFTYTS